MQQIMMIPVMIRNTRNEDHFSPSVMCTASSLHKSSLQQFIVTLWWKNRLDK